VTTRDRQSGFTMLEVLVAMLIAMIGLIGTFAVQQAVLRATGNTNDAGVAMRLASQRLEQFAVAQTLLGPPRVDQLTPFAAITGNAATPTWSAPVFLDAAGGCATGTATRTPTCRWQLEWRVTNTGVNLPFNISVKVTYNLDSNAPKVVRLDLERRKVF
jgi:prepilin-type N-terminal cleavage/methylation domain-containing protein